MATATRVPNQTQAKPLPLVGRKREGRGVASFHSLTPQALQLERNLYFFSETLPLLPTLPIPSLREPSV